MGRKISVGNAARRTGKTQQGIYKALKAGRLKRFWQTVKRRRLMVDETEVDVWANGGS